MPASPPPASSRLPARTTRRTAIAAASALALAGCRWGPEDDIDGARQPTTGEKDADAIVVEQALAALRVRLARLELVSERHVGLATALGPLVLAHTDHARLLSTGTAGETAQVQLPRESAAKALARVRREEAALQVALERAALEATSGDLARALASISASTAQHAAALPTLKTGPA